MIKYVSTLNIVIDANGKSGPNRVGKDMFPVTSFGNHYNLMPFYRVHSWAAPSFYKGLARYSDNCPVDAKSPAAYVLVNGKLPNLEEAGFPKNP